LVRVFWIEAEPIGSANFVYIGIFIAIIITYMIITYSRGFAFAVACLKSATNMHNVVLKVIMHTPMSYFFTTPIGRIINSSDQDKVDEALPDLMYPAIHFSLSSICTLGVITGVIPWFGLTAIPMILLFIWIIRYFMATSRELIGGCVR